MKKIKLLIAYLTISLNFYSLTAVEWVEGTPVIVSMSIDKTTDELIDYEKKSPIQRIKYTKTIKNKTASNEYNLVTNYANVEYTNFLEKIKKPFAKEGLFVGNSSTVVNFTAVTLADTNAFPPDSMGAVGPAQFIAACNGRIRSFSKDSGAADGVLNVSTDTFFASVLPAGSFTSDPRIRYDRLTGRWFIIMISVPSTVTPNRILIAVSNTSIITPSTTWSFYQFQPSAINPPRTNTSDFADFPTLGIDSFALYIGVNVFDPVTDNFINSDAFVINKQALVTSNTLTVTAFRNLIDNTGSGPITPQGVDVFDTTATQGFFIGVDNNQFGTLMLRTVQNPGTTPTLSSNIPITVLSTAYPLLVPHLGNNNGTSGYLSSVDDRLSSTHVRNNLLYTSHNIGVDNNGISGSSTVLTRNGCRWYEIDITTPTSPVLSQAGTAFQPSTYNDFQERHFWMPSIMTNGLHKLVLGCSTAGFNAYADAALFGRSANTTLGQLNGPFFYTGSTTAYNPPGDPGGAEGRRWGDYSHASVDPNDDMTMWIINEFCNATNSYGCQVLKAGANPPAAITGVCPNIICNDSDTITLFINGIIQNRGGFYDPGSTYPNRLSVTIGDVHIISINYVKPTQISVQISAQGAAPGLKDVIVTNPDGQTSVGSSMLNVIPSS